jgi:hypothetical protein
MRWHFLLLALFLIPVVFADTEIVKYCAINGAACSTGECNITLRLTNGTIIQSPMTLIGNIANYTFIEAHARDVNYFVTCCQGIDCETNQYIFNPTSPNYIDLDTCPSSQTGMFMLYGLIIIGFLLLVIGMIFRKYYFIVMSGLCEFGVSPTLGACNLQMGTMLFVVSLIIFIVAVSYMSFRYKK